MVTATSSTNGSAARKPTARLIAAEALITRMTVRRRPKRWAASLPSTLAGRPSTPMSAAKAVALQPRPKAPSPCRPWENTRKVTIQERKANSSQLCAL